MNDIIIFKMKKYTYSSVEIKMEITSISNLKTQLIDKKHFNKSDLVLFIYGGKILSENVDISTITHPICVYVLTDTIKNETNMGNSTFPNLFTFLDSVNHPILPQELEHRSISIPLTNPLSAIMSPAILIPPLIFPYQIELERMLDMGFVNDNILRNSLIMADGNIDEAINIYVNFG